MAVNLSIKDVSDDLAKRLRDRAARNHRSLQGELMAIIEQAASGAPSVAAGAAPQPTAGWTQGWKTIEQIIAERQAQAWAPDPAMARLPRAVDIVRADRDRR